MGKRDMWQAFGLALLAAAVCLGLAMSLAWAQRQGTTDQGIPYVTGGVGDDERAAMDGLSAHYNLKLEFARKDRALLGDVRVALTGPATVDVVSEGPVLMLRLPPGDYAVTAVAGGVAKTTTVGIGQTGMRSATLFW